MNYIRCPVFFAKHCEFSLAGNTMRNARMRGLVVDDNPVNRQIAAKLLERLGFEVDVSACAQEALLRIYQEGYDVVLMDCQMPDMDGMTATRRLREQETRPDDHVFVVGVTAHASKEDCLKAGMDDHIEKPLTLGILQSVLSAHLPSIVTAE